MLRIGQHRFTYIYSIACVHQTKQQQKRTKYSLVYAFPWLPSCVCLSAVSSRARWPSSRSCWSKRKWKWKCVFKFHSSSEDVSSRKSFLFYFSHYTLKGLPLNMCVVPHSFWVGRFIYVSYALFFFALPKQCSIERMWHSNTQTASSIWCGDMVSYPKCGGHCIYDSNGREGICII